MSEMKTEAVEGPFPAFSFPTLFADAVLSIANSPSVVKFYLGRNEPSFSGAGGNQLTAIAQIIMPLDSFVHTFVFFEWAIAKLLKDGGLDEARLEQLRAEQAAAGRVG